MMSRPRNMASPMGHSSRLLAEPEAGFMGAPVVVGVLGLPVLVPFVMPFVVPLIIEGVGEASEPRLEVDIVAAEVAGAGTVRLTPAPLHRFFVKVTVFCKSAALHAFSTTGRSELMKDLSWQMQLMSVIWQPVELRLERAACVAHCGTSEMLCDFTQDKHIIMHMLLVQNEDMFSDRCLRLRNPILSA